MIDKCKELIDKGIRDIGYIFNISKCECDKSCDTGQYLDYESYKCKEIIYKLVKEYIENINESELIYNNTLNNY